MAASISSTGRARDLILAADRSDLEIWLSSLVFEEVERNLRAKAPAGLSMYYELLRGLDELQPGRVIHPENELVIRVAQSIEEKDAPIVAAAVACDAAFLATYDRRHLLSQASTIENLFGVRVATPDEVLVTL
jgi:predicted nucleic acid-binding protein